MKKANLYGLFVVIFLVGCSEMTDWQTYNDQGVEKYQNEEFPAAIELFETAFDKVNSAIFVDKEGKASVTTNLAATYRALGDYENARKYYLESLVA